MDHDFLGFMESENYQRQDWLGEHRTELLGGKAKAKAED